MRPTQQKRDRRVWRQRLEPITSRGSLSSRLYTTRPRVSSLRIGTSTMHSEPVGSSRERMMIASGAALSIAFSHHLNPSGRQRRALARCKVATTGSTRAVNYDELLPAWILKFRDLPCLPDTRGFLRKPPRCSEGRQRQSLSSTSSTSSTGGSTGKSPAAANTAGLCGTPPPDRIVCWIASAPWRNPPSPRSKR